MSSNGPSDEFTIERRGETLILIPSSRLERMDIPEADAASAVILDAIKGTGVASLIVDLEGVDYFGSSFLSLLLRCWKAVLLKGGQLVLAGVSPHARELLQITSLDIVWPIYEDRAEALAALSAD